MDTTNERTVRFWFALTGSENNIQANEPRKGPELKGNNDELRAIVEVYPSETTEALVAWFNITIPLIFSLP